MANPIDSDQPEDEFSDLSQTPYGEEVDSAEPDGDAVPRRAASARFIVDSEVGSEAAMRDAMDPANQSLADALRLSFRVLQAVILVLIVLFLVSGFQTVDEGQSGVQTVWGKIVTTESGEALTPGPKFSIFPYPIGEFVLFREENRNVELASAFSPVLRGAMTHEQRLQNADLNEPLVPGRDGSLLTREGDLAHMEITARYAIDQAGAFVRTVNDSDPSRNADSLVRLALQRAAVNVVAESSLQELIDQTEDIRMRVQQEAQGVLDALHCGIQLTQVQVQRAYAPLAIERSLGELQATRVAAAEAVDAASQRANKIRSDVAGTDFPEIIGLIEQYEDSLEQASDSGTQSEQLLATINTKLEENRDGEVSQIIQRAKTFQSQVESTLGNEYLRFSSLLPAYRKNPNLMIRQLWLEAYSNVVSRRDAEVIYVPDPLMSMTLSVNGSAAIQELRRKAQIARKEREAGMSGLEGRRNRILSGSEMQRHKMLDVKDGKAVPIGK